MATPIFKMGEVAKEMMEFYLSDLIWDGITLGEDRSCHDMAYIWICRRSGTHLIQAAEFGYKSAKSLCRALVPRDDERRYFLIQRPFQDVGRKNAPGVFQEVSGDVAESLIMGRMSFDECLKVAS